MQDRLAAHAAPGESLLLPQQPPPRCLLSTLTTSYAIFKRLEGKGVMYYVHALRGPYSSCEHKGSLQGKTFCECDHHNWKPLDLNPACIDQSSDIIRLCTCISVIRHLAGFIRNFLSELHTDKHEYFTLLPPPNAGRQIRLALMTH